MNSYIRDILASLSKLLTSVISFETVAACWCYYGTEDTLCGIDAACWCWCGTKDLLAPEAAAACRCCCGNVDSPRNEKSGVWVSDGKPLAALYTGSVIVVRLDLWYEFDSDARQHLRADFELRYARAQPGWYVLLHELQVEKSFLIMQLHFAPLGI